MIVLTEFVNSFNFYFEYLIFCFVYVICKYYYYVYIHVKNNTVTNRKKQLSKDGVYKNKFAFKKARKCYINNKKIPIELN